MVESFVLSLKCLLSPPPCWAGSQSQGVGTFYSGFRCALCKLGHHFQIKDLTNIYLSKSQHISWLSSQQPVWLHEVSLPSEAAVGVHLSWACCSSCTELRGISFFHYVPPQRFGTAAYSGRTRQTSIPVSSFIIQEMVA